MAAFRKYFRNKISILGLLCLGLCCKLTAQTDTIDRGFDKNTYPCNALQLFTWLKQQGYSPKKILAKGHTLMYHGNDACGDSLMRLALAAIDTLKSSHWHEYSVQNTKNGNYANSFSALEQAMALNPKHTEGYYGWVLLYYFRDYRRALSHLTAHDNRTPGTPDFPVGENVDFLKGLCYYNLKKFDSAYACFHKDIDWIIKDRGIENVNGFSFFYAARCLDHMDKPAQALQEYDQSIKLVMFPTEAYYYSGLLLLKTNKNKGIERLSKAKQFIDRGFKQQDIYIELFDEVYPAQLAEALKAAK